MVLKVRKSQVGGCARIPGSKSHTIRALFFSSLAGGNSTIRNPLLSNDTISAAEVCKAFGAKIETSGGDISVHGFGSCPKTPEDVINVGNSGTTLRLGLMAAGLSEGCSVFTGDYQIRRRPLAPLIAAMNNLGAEVFSTRGNGMAPVVVKGKLKGGCTELDAITSQYLSSILISAPLIEKDTEIRITRLNEVPYVEMTMWWLDRMGIAYQNDGFRTIAVKGGQSYKPFDTVIPGDFSSATFFMVLAAISGCELLLQNLDMSDYQGDKKVLSYLEAMGTEVKFQNDGILVRGRGLKGIEIDMNSTPDALPAMAVAGCFAEGETRLVNVPQARLKETDRISVMHSELTRLGADITELPDGLVIRNSRLKGSRVSGRDDHRVVMALAIAGLNIEGETVIETAEAASVTFPEFPELARSLGGDLELVNEENCI